MDFTRQSLTPASVETMSTGTSPSGEGTSLNDLFSLGTLTTSKRPTAKPGSCLATPSTSTSPRVSTCIDLFLGRDHAQRGLGAPLRASSSCRGVASGARLCDEPVLLAGDVPGLWRRDALQLASSALLAQGLALLLALLLLGSRRLLAGSGSFSRRCRLSLSSRFRLVITTFEASIGTGLVFPPAIFSRVTPSMKSLPELRVYSGDLPLDPLEASADYPYAVSLYRPHRRAAVLLAELL